jgi:serine/threonine protein kinase
MDTPPPFPTAGEPPSVTPSKPLGRMGEYHLLRKLAQGGMAEIFLAKRLRVGGFEKTFVVKRMLDSLSGSPEFVSMFFDEAQLAARLSHPNIAQIYDFGVIDGRYYIAMEHIPGEDVRTIIGRLFDRNLKIPVPIAMRIVAEVCAGLDYAHTLTDNGKPLDIIHRDVSPSNIMVSYQGAVKLLDFGIAKATSRVSETRTGNVKGKFSFLAPEQIKGLPIDGRADVFSLGISFYELLTKRRPFRRDSELATIHAILHDELPDARQFRENLPDGVVAILSKALERDRDRRFRSAGEMGTALRNSLTQIAPGMSAADLATFMVALFGRPAMEDKSHVPSLAQVNLAEFVRGTSDSPAGTPGPATAPLAPGTEAPGVGESPKGPPLAASRGSRVKRRVAWLLGALGIAAAGAGAAVLVMGADPKGDPASDPAALAEEAVGVPPSASDSEGTTGSVPSTGPVAPGEAAAASASGPAEAQAGSAEGKGPVPATTAPQARPRTRPAGAVAEKLEPLTSDALQTVVKKAHPRFSSCFKRYTAELPGATGEVTIHLAVAASGKVASARASLPGFSSAALAGCLEQEAERMRFPRHPDKEIRFTFPLVYRKGGAE